MTPPRLLKSKPPGPGDVATVVLACEARHLGSIVVKVKLGGEAERVAAEATIGVAAAGLDERVVGPRAALWCDVGRRPFVMAFPLVGRAVADDLRERYAARSCTLGTFTAEAATLARVLCKLHQNGVVWGDPKPDNLRTDGKWRIIDFSVGSLTAPHLRVRGPVGRSRWIAAPEKGRGPLSDQFEFAATLLCLLLLRADDADRDVRDRFAEMRAEGFGEAALRYNLLSTDSYFAGDGRLDDLSDVLVQMLSQSPDDRFPRMQDAALAMELAVPPARRALSFFSFLLP